MVFILTITLLGISSVNIPKKLLKLSSISSGVFTSFHFYMHFYVCFT
jgi:hypothetical protein